MSREIDFALVDDVSCRMALLFSWKTEQKSRHESGEPDCGRAMLMWCGEGQVHPLNRKQELGEPGEATEEADGARLGD
jgi:hypothetical protein